MQTLKQTAVELRRDIIKMCHLAGAGHITSACSCLDILITLYFGGGKQMDGIMNYRAEQPLWQERDFFILSKGHAGVGLYAVLAKAGFITKEELWTFCSVGTRLGCHPSPNVPGVENTSGSLGHGLSFSVGLALGAKLKNTNQKVYCITGDGELQEGSNWEAALSISHFKLDNLVWIIDKNDLQILGTIDEVMSLGNLHAKLISFGFDVTEIDGHNFLEIDAALVKQTNKPHAIIAHTLKGGGIASLEGKRNWHNRKPNNEELESILSDLGMTHEDLAI